MAEKQGKVRGLWRCLGFENSESCRGRDVIVRSYSPEEMNEVGVEVTANHMGYFQFSLCPFVPATQKCFDTFPLKSKNGKTKFDVGRGTGKRFMQVETY